MKCNNKPITPETAEHLKEYDEDTTFTPLQAIKAIKAVLHSEWDNRQLQKLGGLLTDDFENIKRIINCTRIN